MAPFEADFLVTVVLRDGCTTDDAAKRLAQLGVVIAGDGELEVTAVQWIP